MNDPFAHFVVDNDGAYVGHHAIIELWGVTNHRDEAAIEAAFINVCRTIGATVVFSHVHGFGPQAGTTGVIVLSESHLSWHHYPECGYLAIDIFVCGKLDPAHGFDAISAFWKPAKFESRILRRGEVADRAAHRNALS